MADQTFTRDSITRKMRDMGDGSFAEVVHAPPAISDSVANGGSVTTPAAGANVTSIASGSLPAGIYDVSFGVLLSGTTETQTANVKIKKGATVITQLPTISGAAPVTDDIKRVTLDGTTALNMVVTALATTGAVYNGWLIATRVG
jgi:hypothetical protein